MFEMYTFVELRTIADPSSFLDTHISVSVIAPLLTCPTASAKNGNKTLKMSVEQLSS